MATVKEKILCIDEDGAEYTVVVFQHWIEVKTQKGQTDIIPGQTEATLLDGRHVNWVNDEPNAFKIFDSGIIIRAVDRD